MGRLGLLGIALLLTYSIIGCTGAFRSLNIAAQNSQNSNPTGDVNDDKGVQAARANDFINSIGVNTHLSSETYSSVYANIIKPRLRELGIRHVRDGLELKQDVFDRIKDLSENAEVKFDLVVEPRHYTVEQAHDAIVNQIGVDRIDSIEGINEADGWFSSQVSDWVSVSTAHQKNLYEIFKDSQDTNQIPILAPTLISEESVPRLAELSSFYDYGNFHPYPGGRQPETSGWGDCKNGACYGSLEYDQYNYATIVGGGKLNYVTESGYHNALAAHGGHPGISEEAAGKYIPRLSLYYFSMGIVRTFFYELYDEDLSPADQEANFGLLRHDGSPKPAYTAMKNLIRRLSDTAGDFAPGKLNYLISGETENLRTVLLQKRDGSFLLLFWLDKPVWDVNAYVDISVHPQKVSFSISTLVDFVGLASLENTQEFSQVAKPYELVNVLATDSIQILQLIPHRL